MKRNKSKKLLRREREYAARREEILAAAEKVFVLKGYYQATIEEIAQQAEFAAGTIYNFFDSKEDLYQEVMLKIAQDFMNLFGQNVLTQNDPEDAIAALIELRLTHFQKHHGFFRVLFEASPDGRFSPPHVISRKCLEIHDSYISQVTDIFKRGVKDGTFDKLDPLYLALCLEGTIRAFVIYFYRFKPDEPMEVSIRKMQETFLSRIQIKLESGKKNSNKT